MKQNNTRLDVSSLAELIWENLRIFLVVGVLALIGSVIVAMVLPVYFTSTVTIFPAKTTSMPFDERYVRQGNLSDFGEEEEAEQLLQILHSSTMFFHLAEKFELYDHYEVDPEGKHPVSKLRKMYKESVDINRTRYNSIEINVTDRDAQFAADMANSIAEYADEAMNIMIRKRASSALNYMDEEKEKLESTLRNYTDTLNKYQDMGVLTELERASLIEAYGESLRSSNAAVKEELKQQLAINREYGDEYDLLKTMRDRTTDRLARMQGLYDQINADANIAISHQFVVDSAVPADKKSYPVRWLIVVMITGAAILMTLVLLVLADIFF